jgi:hypothetical protein
MRVLLLALALAMCAPAAIINTYTADLNANALHDLVMERYGEELRISGISVALWVLPLGDDPVVTANVGGVVMRLAHQPWLDPLQMGVMVELSEPLVWPGWRSTLRVECQDCSVQPHWQFGSAPVGGTHRSGGSGYQGRIEVENWRDLSVQETPEPATWAWVAAGLIGILARRQRAEDLSDSRAHSDATRHPATRTADFPSPGK